MTTNMDFIDTSYMQHTLKSSFTCMGQGLHTGIKAVLRVFPGEVNTGIIFERRDIDKSRSEIQANWQNISDTKFSITLTNALNVSVATVDHIMAALYACDIDNARILIDGPEVPIMDGSTDTFVSLINQAGRKKQNAQRHAIIVKQPVSITVGEQFASFTPSPVPWLEMESESNGLNDNDSNSKFAAPIHKRIFEDELAAARVFVFSEQLDTFRKRGYLKNSTQQNSVLVENGKVINPNGLRFEDEFIRHELVISLGAIALMGARVIGQFNGIHNDQRINHALIKKLITDRDTWEYATLKKANDYWAEVLNKQDKKNPLVQELMSRFEFCTQLSFR